jgi:16S rRNA (guanine1207-N2)-methyltransferase
VVADLGCGSGVIGITLAKLNPKAHAHLLDVNLRVVELAKENVELNGLENAEVYLSDLFSAVDNRTYHQIFSNPAQHLGNDFLEEVAKECFKHLKPDGSVFWVMQNHLRPVAERILQKHFGNFEILDRGRDHIIIKAVRK